MNKNREKITVAVDAVSETASTPTFDQVPTMLADLSRKFDEFLSMRQDVVTGDSLPMGINRCADFLTQVEGKRVTVSAVYNRVAKGRLPYHKNGAKLFFLQGEVLESLTKPKKFQQQFSEVS